jgi:hypothetical protein
MKAFDFHVAHATRAGLILLFDGEVVRPAKQSEPDEHSTTGILTSGFASLRLPDFWSVASREVFSRWSSYPDTVAQPSRIFTGFPDIALRLKIPHMRDSFKERAVRTLAKNFCQEVF